MIQAADNCGHSPAESKKKPSRFMTDPIFRKKMLDYQAAYQKNRRRTDPEYKELETLRRVRRGRMRGPNHSSSESRLTNAEIDVRIEELRASIKARLVAKRKAKVEPKKQPWKVNKGTNSKVKDKQTYGITKTKLRKLKGKLVRKIKDPKFSEKREVFVRQLSILRSILRQNRKLHRKGVAWTTPMLPWCHPACYNPAPYDQKAVMQLAALKRAAKEEYRLMMKAWKEKWAAVLPKNGGKSRATRERRDAAIRLTTVHSTALSKQLRVIASGPCHCYWCSILLPHGGTVDHILALAKGGGHTAANVCAACPDCNSRKSDHKPETVGLQGTLL